MMSCGIHVISSRERPKHSNHEGAEIVRQDFQVYSHLCNYNQKYCTHQHHNSDVWVIYRCHIRLFDIYMFSIVHRRIECWILCQNRNNVALGQIRNEMKKI